MRIYQNLYECSKETQRNLWEMGHIITLNSMQNLKGNFETREILGETFRILDPTEKLKEAYKLIYLEDEEVIKQFAWVHEEFNERINPHFVNPGNAWNLRYNTWKKFMKDGKFEYTYNERLNLKENLNKIVKHFRNDLNSRRVAINIYDASKDLDKLATVERVPCSLGYSFIIRNSELHMFYSMRSSDLYSHFLNDVSLARMFQNFLAQKIGSDIKVGWLQMNINSLHAYREDLIKRNIF